MHDFAWYLWALVLIGVIGIPAATSVVLYQGAVVAGLARWTALAIGGAAATLLGGWIVASALLGGAGVYHRSSGEATPWLGAAFAGTLTALLLAARIPVVARSLAHAGTAARLAVPHSIRVVGVVFLIAMAQGKLPAVFALPAGLGDIAVGLSAPFVARRLARDRDRRGAVRFNLLGILDLVVALGIGFLAGLGPYRPLAVTPSTDALAVLPLVLVPTVAVPLAIALHVVSLGRLRAASGREAESHGRAPSRVLVRR